MPATTLFTPKQANVPEFGTIEGGLGDGWSFIYMDTILQDGKPYLILSVTKNQWPFPRKVRMGKGDYLRLVPGKGAQIRQIEDLIEAATNAAGKPQ